MHQITGSVHNLEIFILLSPVTAIYTYIPSLFLYVMYMCRYVMSLGLVLKQIKIQKYTGRCLQTRQKYMVICC